MIHYTLPRRRTPRVAISLLSASQALAAATPVTADRYLRLRREAAGLTILQAARRMFGNDDAKVRIAVDLITALETPGVRAKVDLTLDRLSLAFSFDADVYRQLAHDTADRHPRVCCGCGCSQNDACVSGDGHASCGWALSSPRDGFAICTRCAGGDL